MAHQTIGVETVLSTDKYRRLVKRAKGLGFSVKLLFVTLDSPKRNVERVKIRVAKGGHPVPEEKIVSRYWRSLDQMPWFLNESDDAWVYDNSGATPTIIARKQNDVLTIYANAKGNILNALKRIELY